MSEGGVGVCGRYYPPSSDTPLVSDLVGEVQRRVLDGWLDVDCRLWMWVWWILDVGVVDCGCEFGCGFWIWVWL
ncbi:hypothetical protein Pmani_037768 [Petrolisthes manimaculis]|uniref:Uncharacterized protein n=1 Tax=Petrolisthes manimaculis TaxID=1843537 RepID=A0AAE1NFS3_9EUCA|nr:hypothetical protein Pmani_037768 [Petrolisthes manimaculis]